MKRISFSIVVILSALTLVTLGTRATAQPTPQPAPCDGLEVVESEILLCTHGGDPVEAFDESPEPQSASRDARIAQAAPARCPDGGLSGKRVEVLYAVPQDKTNNYAASLASVRAAVDDADFSLDQSTPTFGGQHYRWLCENGSDVTVRNVTLIPIGSDGQFTYGDMVQSLQNQVGLGLGPTNFVSSDRAYLVFVDQIAGAYPFGGQGNIFNDDSPSPSANLHQSGPHYSLVNGFSGFVAEHELGHNFGAVQLSAPHTSGGWHCFEENDVMCYPDGGSYFAAGGAIVVNCPTLPATHFDCGQDDYYSVQPAVGTYLTSHWNVTDSDFLTDPIPPSTLDHFKCYQAKQVGARFDPREVVLTDQFTTERIKVIRPVGFCTPADKDGSGIHDPVAHLTCYAVRDTRRDRSDKTKPILVTASDQFGSLNLRLKKTRTLCLPSLKTIP